jgi:hypothetical protein
MGTLEQGAGALAGGSSAQLGLIAVWPQDVRDLKARLDPSFVATDEAVTRCASSGTIAGSVVSDWKRFFAAWRGYVAADVPIWGLGAVYDDGLAYQTQHQGWRALLRGQGCSINAPDLPAEKEDPLAATLTAAKYVGGAVVALAVVYGIAQLVRIVK